MLLKADRPTDLIFSNVPVEKRTDEHIIPFNRTDGTILELVEYQEIGLFGVNPEGVTVAGIFADNNKSSKLRAELKSLHFGTGCGKSLC